MATLNRPRVAAAALFCAAMFLAFPGRSSAQDTGDTLRKVVAKVNPQYPALAHTMSLKGSVKVEALILPNGTVKSVEIKGGHPVLAQAAADAVRKWKYEPAPHETRQVIEIHFNPE